MNSPPPTTYTVRARSTVSGQADIHVADQRIPCDVTWPPDPSGLPGPAELLAAAFAACMLKNLQRAHQLLDFGYDHAEVEVIARRQDSPPIFVEITYELRIATEETQRRIDLVHQNLRKYGTVYNTLAAVCNVHGHVVATQSPPMAPEPKAWI